MYELYVVPFSNPNSMSNRSRSQSSDRISVVPSPSAVACVCNRFFPSNSSTSDVLTASRVTGGSVTARAIPRARRASRARVVAPRARSPRRSTRHLDAVASARVAARPRARVVVARAIDARAIHARAPRSTVAVARAIARRRVAT